VSTRTGEEHREECNTVTVTVDPEETCLTITNAVSSLSRRPLHRTHARTQSHSNHQVRARHTKKVTLILYFTPRGAGTTRLGQNRYPKGQIFLHRRPNFQVVSLADAHYYFPLAVHIFSIWASGKCFGLGFDTFNL
jgi:hypothetical protein